LEQSGEAHSHPELQRKFFDDLKLISAQKQIFIATHSPIFIDKANPEDTWIVKIVDGKTEIQRIKELKEVLEEIGARPSDIFFFADRILFVEGKTEETIIPAFAERLGIDLRDLAIIPVEGKDQARLHLKTWIKITRNVLPIFLILDNDAKKAVDELIREGLIEHEKCHLWQKGSIEAYYPLEILSTALDELNSRYNLEMNVSEIMEKIRKGELTPDKIDLGGKRKLLDKSWEVILGGTVTKILREKEVHISDEVRRALEKAVE
jgi:predicted ATP-dependent endonuclease of OLD family